MVVYYKGKFQRSLRKEKGKKLRSIMIIIPMDKKVRFNLQGFILFQFNPFQLIPAQPLQFTSILPSSLMPVQQLFLSVVRTTFPIHEIF